MLDFRDRSLHGCKTPTYNLKAAEIKEILLHFSLQDWIQMHLKQDHRSNNARYVAQVPLLRVHAHLEDNGIAENRVRLSRQELVCKQTYHKI